MSVLMLHRELDAIQDHTMRLELLLRGVFAGNIFDLGAATSADLFKSKGVSSASCICKDAFGHVFTLSLSAYIDGVEFEGTYR